MPLSKPILALNVMKGQGDSQLHLPSQEELQRIRLDKTINHYGKVFLPYQKDTKVLFTRYDNYKLVKTELTTVLQHIVEIGLFKSVLSIHYMPNPLFISVELDTPLDVLRFVELSYIMDGLNTKILTGKETIKNITITIDKLPRDVIMEQVPALLQKWGKIIAINTETIMRPDGTPITIGQSTIDFLLNDNSTIEDIPYFLRVLGINVFLHIRGR